MIRKTVGYILLAAAAVISFCVAVDYLNMNAGTASDAVTSEIRLARPFLIVTLIVALGIIGCFFVFKKEKRWLGSVAVVILGLLWIRVFGDSLSHRSVVLPVITMAAPGCRGMEAPQDLSPRPVGIPSGCFMHFVVLDGTVVFQSGKGSKQRRGTGSTVPLDDNFGAVLAWGDPSAKVVFYFCPLGTPRWSSSGCTS